MNERICLYCSDNLLQTSISYQILLCLGIASQQAGWFRKHYTSIDTVQKIYGTHPRYQGTRRGHVTSRVRPNSVSRVRPSSVGHARSRHVRCNTGLSHAMCQDGCYNSPSERRKLFAKTGSLSVMSSPNKIKIDSNKQTSTVVQQ